MELFTTPEEMRRWSREQRTAGHTIAIVPTMGALHAGHLALIDEANNRADLVIVTVFVNPLQFNESADFDAYPRPLDDDITRSCEMGAAAVYVPSTVTMYPVGYQTHVEPGALADRLEGPMRPGHFRGVATVVAKLLGATAPDIAIFGQKDFQQFAIVKQMSADLDLGVEIVGVPTVREPDGLAMSSRNLLLSPEQRAAAVVISRALGATVEAFDAGERAVSTLCSLAAGLIDSEPLSRLEYVELVDPATLEQIDHVHSTGVVLVAAWFGGVRLIDNRVLGD